MNKTKGFVQNFGKNHLVLSTYNQHLQNANIYDKNVLTGFNTDLQRSDRNHKITLKPFE